MKMRCGREYCEGAFRMADLELGPTGTDIQALQDQKNP